MCYHTLLSHFHFPDKDPVVRKMDLLKFTQPTRKPAGEPSSHGSRLLILAPPQYLPEKDACVGLEGFIVM